jgi:hypothetical protein
MSETLLKIETHFAENEQRFSDTLLTVYNADYCFFDPRALKEHLNSESVCVGTGKIQSTAPENDMYTEQLRGCVGVFVPGSKQNTLVHMVSGNDPSNFGFWEDEYSAGLQEKSVKKIRETLDSDQKKVIICYNKITGKWDNTEQVRNLVETFQKEGMNVEQHEIQGNHTSLYYRAKEKKIYVITKETKGITVNSIDI